MPDSRLPISLNFEHTYHDQLPGFFVALEPHAVTQPHLLQFNTGLANELGINCEQLTPEIIENLFSGNTLPLDANPIAQAYAGHQFGNFVPQLGDGRALLIGELIDQNGIRRDVALKGSGITPFSRGGDGKAAVGPVLREYLIGEAMHALGIPTTRALAAVATGEPVMREQKLPGAVLTRVASSHIRVGTFQFFAARQLTDSVRKLADYVIQRHYPDASESPNCYLSLLQLVADQQAKLIAQWMLVGFIHGVMNTDNMAIAGETIDYGPCAFMEAYNPDTVFSSIDHGGRYAFGNQPSIAVWNLARFAETLLPLINEADSEAAIAEATAVLDTFIPTFQNHWFRGALKKLGLAGNEDTAQVGEQQRALIDDWFQWLAKGKVDYTLGWRYLADAATGNPCKLQSISTAPNHSASDDTANEDLASWLARWREQLGNTDPETVATTLRGVNPIHIPRNHLVEEALAAASDDGNLQPFETLLAAVKQPFDDSPHAPRYSSPATAEYTANYRTFCGT